MCDFYDLRGAKLFNLLSFILINDISHPQSEQPPQKNIVMLHLHSPIFTLNF